MSSLLRKFWEVQFNLRVICISLGSPQFFQLLLSNAQFTPIYRHLWLWTSKTLLRGDWIYIHHRKQLSKGKAWVRTKQNTRMEATETEIMQIPCSVPWVLLPTAIPHLFFSQGLSLLSCSWQNLYSQFYPDVNTLELNTKSTTMG